MGMLTGILIGCWLRSWVAAFENLNSLPDAIFGANALTE
jgi:hypothetical protein